jgi:hypothetical protein
LEGRKIRVVNAGLNYATTGELLCHFIFRGKYLNPDLVILDGPGNDFLPAANGDNTTDYRKTRHSIYFNKRRGEKLLLKSRIVQCIYLFVVTSKNLIVMEPPNFKLGADLEQNELLKSNDGRIVKSNVESLIAIVKEMNIHLILVDFLRPSPKVMMDNYPLVWEGLGVFESTISQHYSDLSLKHPDRVLHIRSDEFHQLLDKDFHDVCHLTIEGDLKKAYVITNALTNWLSKKLR